MSETKFTVTSSCGNADYSKIWRRYNFAVRFVIYLGKTTSTLHLKVSSSPSSPPSPRGQLSWSIDIPSEEGKEEDGKEEDGKEVISKIVKRRDLRSLTSFGGVRQVASVLGSDLEIGIDEGSGFRSHSMSWIGYPVHSTTWRFICNLLEACNRPAILLLLVSSGFSFAVDIKEQGPLYGWHDGVAILVAVLLLVTSRMVTDFQRQRKQGQEKEKRKLEVRVVRNGERRLIFSSDLRVGDLVYLEKGDIVPADGLYVNGGTLVLDEVLNAKIDQENPFLFSGSKVIEGHGHMILVDTNIGSDDPEERTLLETRIEKPQVYADNISLIGTVLIAIIVSINLLIKRATKNDGVLPELKGDTKIAVLMNILENMFWRPTGKIPILTGALTAIVIGMQHGTSLVITVSLSYWNKKVKFSTVEPQNLSACATTGLVTVFCINATGGVICSQMEVNEFHVGREDMNGDVVGNTNPVVLEALCQAIGASSSPVPEKPGCVPDNSLASWAKSRLGRSTELSDQNFCVINHGRLGSENNCSQVLIMKNGDDGENLHLHIKGDASAILSLCSHYYNTKGEIHAIEDQRRYFERVIEDMENKGLRPVALACKRIETQEPDEESSRLLALIGLKFSFRETLQALKNAGVSIKLISQDELSAVKYIAHGLGVIPPGSNDVELEGEQIRDLTETERIKETEKAIVIANCQSEDMLLIVRSLHQNDNVVAFFGGLSTMDIPAFKESDLRIIKENQSTELARKSSDIIILDKSSSVSLYDVTKHGRCAYNNMQIFTQLQLTTCISGLLINVVAAICLWDSPLSAIQLIWVNFTTCLLGGLMMVMDLRSQELMVNLPPIRTEPLLNEAIWRNIATQVLSQTCLLVLLRIIGHENEETWISLAFNSFMLCQVCNQFKAMGMPSKEVAKAVIHHYWFLLASGTVMVMQVLIVEFGTSREKLNPVHWVISFGTAALSWILGTALDFISVSLSNRFSPSYGSNHDGSSRRTRRSPLSLTVSLLGIPLSVIFVFSLPHYFYPDHVNAFRR